MGRRRTISDSTIREISRLRAKGLQFKEIARALNCSPEQARHYHRKFCDVAYEHGCRSRALKSKRINQGLKNIEAARKQQKYLDQSTQKIIAERALKRDIAAAVAEQNTAPLYKPGHLVWGD